MTKDMFIGETNTVKDQGEWRSSKTQQGKLVEEDPLHSNVYLSNNNNI